MVSKIYEYHRIEFGSPMSSCTTGELPYPSHFPFHSLTHFYYSRSADEGFDGTYPTNVVVRSNGSCLYVPPGIFKSTCKIDITWFPFDDQRCEMKFGSWTYDGFQLDLQLQDETGGDISSFVTNGEWDLLGKFSTIPYIYVRSI